MEKKYQIQLQDAYGFYLDWAKIENILSFYLPYIQKNILVESTGSDDIHYGNKNRLCIHNQILPKKFENGCKYKITKFASIFGFNIDQIHDRNGLQPSLENGPVFYSPEGMPIAQIIKQKDIYFLYNWCGKNRPVAYKVLEETMKFYIDMGNLGLRINYEINIEKMARQKLADTYASMMAEKINKLKRNLKEYEKEIIKYSDMLIRSMRERDAKRMQINHYEKDDAYQIISLKIQTELEKLKTLKFVKEVRFNICDQTIAMSCKKLVLPDSDGVKYHIGRLRINFTLDGQISIENLDYITDDCQHPHVQNKKNICIGPVYESAIKHLAVFNIVIAAELIWRQLNKYNRSDAMQSIDYWPKVISE